MTQQIFALSSWRSASPVYCCQTVLTSQLLPRHLLFRSMIVQPYFTQNNPIEPDIAELTGLDDPFTNSAGRNVKRLILKVCANQTFQDQPCFKADVTYRP
ncbi:hypothetical protein E2R51_14215 [Jeotgalibacillus sp. S-D1]|uniref:hypothetical protein n=1 Tax=Jeotgalibacillus sp. S-D1 TaxID=2552189 RepID=UPI00105991EF|nr:hypothetical protein [Jeotgalibacillus sp. S-D1]TDL31512.1 hypothetical protein E2R51_14215 [Jeotgalibacillus sp. S-D1]